MTSDRLWTILVTMYVRKSTRRYKDRTYTNYLLVESVSTPKGPRQKVVCSLGDLRPRPREAWLRLAHKVQAALAGEQELFEPADGEVATAVARARARSGAPPEDSGEVVAVRTEEVAIEQPREAGPVHVGYEFWRRLGLQEILAQAGLSVRATKLACAMTLNRLINPSSEHAMPAWMRRTAIHDVLGVEVETLTEDPLYRMLDTLHPQRALIEKRLGEQERELFDLGQTVFFYDLTSSYFEGQALANPKAMRGYSRDSRPDCKQVVIGLVIDRQGFPVAHEIFEGKRQDRQSLAEMLDVLDARVGLAPGQMIVVDRGMAYDNNLATIRARKLHYLVAARQTERDCWLDDFEADDLVEILRPTSPNNPRQKKSRVWIARRETDNELLVLCKSEGRIAKDRAIREKQEARLLADLAKLARRIETGRLVKQQAIGEAIGRLRERYPRVARYWRIECDHKAKRLLYAEDEAKRSKAERLDGCYLLKTDRKDLSTEEAWKIYMTLTRAEDAFRDMKSPLAERPIFHQLEHRVETHIFLCLLAYHLLVAIETTLERASMFTSWATVRDALRSHQIVTIVLPTTAGPILRIRKGSTPEPHQRELYRLLGVPDEIIPPRKTWSRRAGAPA